MSRQKAVLVDPETLFVTHIYDGEEIVCGGEDGKTWVATFADAHVAEVFVRFCKDQLMKVRAFPYNLNERTRSADAHKEYLKWTGK